MSGIDIDAVYTLDNVCVESDWVEEATLVQVESVDFIPRSGYEGIAGWEMIGE